MKARWRDRLLVIWGKDGCGELLPGLLRNIWPLKGCSGNDGACAGASFLFKFPLGSGLLLLQSSVLWQGGEQRRQRI